MEDDKQQTTETEDRSQGVHEDSAAKKLTDVGKKANDKVKDAKRTVKVIKFLAPLLPVIFWIAGIITVAILLFSLLSWLKNLITHGQTVNSKNDFTSSVIVNQDPDEEHRVSLKVNSNNGKYTFNSNYEDWEIQEFVTRILKDYDLNIDGFGKFEKIFLMELEKNGLSIQYYTEEELHALFLFYKAEAATDYIDTRPYSQRFNEDGSYKSIKYSELKDAEISGVIQLRRAYWRRYWYCKKIFRIHRL